MRKILAAVLVSISLSGCIAQNIIGANKRQNFAELNFEREKAGLAPLTWQEYNSPGSR